MAHVTLFTKHIYYVPPTVINKKSRETFNEARSAYCNSAIIHYHIVVAYIKVIVFLFCFSCPKELRNMVGQMTQSLFKKVREQNTV